MRQKLLLGLAGLVLLANSACLVRAASPTPTPARVPPLTMEEVTNAEFQSEFASGGKIRLTDGAFMEKLTTDPSSRLTVRMTDKYAFGDLNGDGVGDAVAALASNTGGTGTFIDLVAVINVNGNPNHVATQDLGDRVILKAILINEAGEVTVEMTKHGPNDPLCCPTMDVVQRYRLQGDKLSQVS